MRPDSESWTLEWDGQATIVVQVAREPFGNGTVGMDASFSFGTRRGFSRLDATGIE
jgi:hypothetical protein